MNLLNKMEMKINFRGKGRFKFGLKVFMFLALVFLIFNFSFDKLVDAAINEDNLGRITSMTPPDADPQISYSYYGITDSLKEIYSNDWSYKYDSSGNLLSESYTQTPEINVEYTYYPDGNLFSIKKGGVTTKFTYNSNGFLSGEVTSSGGTEIPVSYTYDSENRSEEIISAGYRIKYTYNSDGFVDSETVKRNVNVDGTLYLVEEIANYTYDSDGNIINVNDNTGVEFSYEYETVNYTCEEIQCTNFNCVDGGECYTFYNCDTNGENCASYNCSNYTFVNATCNYTRLKSRDYNNDHTEVVYNSEGFVDKYTTDAGGFGLDYDYTPFEVYNPDGLLAKDDFFSYDYDSDSRLKKVASASDPSSYFDLDYGPDEILKNLTYSEAFGSVAEEKEKYVYDGLGREFKTRFVDWRDGPTPSSPSGFTALSILPLTNFLTGFFSVITGMVVDSSSGTFENDYYYIIPGYSVSVVSKEDLDVILEGRDSFAPELSQVLTDVEEAEAEIMRCTEHEGVTNNPSSSEQGDFQIQLVENPEYYSSYPFVSSDGGNYPDTCSADSMSLVKFGCGFGGVNTQVIDCPYGCYGGRCLDASEGINISQPCLDYDSNSSIGEEFANSLFNSSFVVYNGQVFNDSCFNSTHVTENYCELDSILGAIFGGDLVRKSAIKKCSYGCYNGACLVSLVNCSNNIQDGLETGIDCGGNCPNENCCSNSAQDINELGVDCGGNCTTECLDLPDIIPGSPGRF